MDSRIGSSCQQLTFIQMLGIVSYARVMLCEGSTIIISVNIEEYRPFQICQNLPKKCESVIT